MKKDNRKYYMEYKKLPFTYHWIIRRVIGTGIKTVLDIGCGDGELMEKISKGENWEITGLDLHTNSITEAKKRGVYIKLLKSDVVKLPESILKTKYDLVFCSQAIEHLDKKDGEKAIKIWEKLAIKKVLISTPVGFIPYHRVELSSSSSNPLNTHLSGWSPGEFTQLGYSVYGQGSKLVYGESGLIRKTPKFLWPLLIVLSYMVSVFVYYLPNLATYLIAIKNK